MTNGIRMRARAQKSNDRSNDKVTAKSPFRRQSSLKIFCDLEAVLQDLDFGNAGSRQSNDYFSGAKHPELCVLFALFGEREILRERT